MTPCKSDRKSGSHRHHLPPQALQSKHQIRSFGLVRHSGKPSTKRKTTTTTTARANEEASKEATTAATIAALKVVTTASS